MNINTFIENPLISIITVVYNGEKYLEKTIQSVINQTYKNIEYIIIDGGSTDGTLDIIKKYEDKISYWTSEKDEGIYDAMNKAIQSASGDWINFMNSGDKFNNENVLQIIFENRNFDGIDILYGHHRVIYSNRTKIIKAGSIQNIWKGSQFCHQSAFVRAELYKIKKFNLCYKIGADFNFFYSEYKQGKKFKKLNLIVADYSAYGFSDINRIDSIVEWWHVIDKSNIVNIYYICIIVREILKYYIKKIFYNEDFTHS